ncbi:hypothetical protein [Neisseria zalophi]|uniref:Uncharacterized protein n=1 Tax=Neisseria zalophi TaxID=640030 RepID=A0A5J6PT16_9NEIS|nr:hypothetical protein [Neisseria zalophi]QEY25789.1 hypothetical protein D0T92_04035 [Neisseria zalophi]
MMKKIVLVTGGTKRQRNCYIANQQSHTKNRDIRAILPLSNEEILYDLENAWGVDLYISMDDTKYISQEILDRVTERVHLSDKNGKLSVIEIDNYDNQIKYDNDTDISCYQAITHTQIVIIGNSDDGRTIFPPELLNVEGCNAAFSFGILLSTRELHDPFAHLETEIACRLDKLFSYNINTVSYDPKTRTGFASISNSSPPDVGTIRYLPEDK